MKIVNHVKTMLVLHVPKGKDGNWTHVQLLAGGFNINQPVISAYGTDDDGRPHDDYGFFFMQEIASGANG